MTINQDLVEKKCGHKMLKVYKVSSRVKSILKHIRPHRQCPTDNYGLINPLYPKGEASRIPPECHQRTVKEKYCRSLYSFSTSKSIRENLREPAKMGTLKEIENAKWKY